MKVLVLGASGMLGSDLVQQIRSRGHDASTPSSNEFDIANPESAAGLALERGAYDWCINCAAYTAVDKAESQPRLATEINALGPGYLSNACNMAGIKLIHISTDFVFDGGADSPYKEDSPTRPLGVYGQTKREGETAVLSANPNALIVRTSWLYGVHGQCFPKTMIGAWKAGKDLRVVADQTGCPTYTGDLSRVLVDLIEINAYPGIYHACGPNVATWHSFAVDAVSAWARLVGDDRPVQIEAIPTEAYPTPARRPKYSVLSTEKVRSLGVAPMRSLSDALVDFAKHLLSTKSGPQP